jgi:hypothetical protein
VSAFALIIFGAYAQTVVFFYNEGSCLAALAALDKARPGHVNGVCVSGARIP